MYYIGVDIGGMSVKIGVVDKSGKILKSTAIETEKISPIEQIKKIADSIFKLLDESQIKKSKIKGIGVGCPGAVQNPEGIVLASENLDWYDVKIKEILEEITGIEVKVVNDADAATAGEAIYGCAKKFNNVIMLTIGTGIGGGIIVDKKLYKGTNGVAAELGHITLKMGGLPCGCGRKGCYEKYASATALISQTKTAMLKHPESLMWSFVKGDLNKVNGITSFACAKEGDKTANKVVNTFIKYIAEGILNYCNIFRPDAIVLGGAISKEGEYLTRKIVRYLKKNRYGYPCAPQTQILTASLKNDAGIIGAVSVFVQDKV